MAKGFKEFHVEEDLVEYLTNTANPKFPEYVQKDNSVYNKEWCVIPEDIIGFIKETQKEKYDALAVQYGNAVDDKIVERVVDTYKKSQHKTIKFPYTIEPVVLETFFFSQNRYNFLVH